MKLLELLNYQNYQNYIQTDANNSLLKLDDDSEIDIKTEGVDKRNMNEEKGESGEHFLIIFFSDLLFKHERWGEIQHKSY